MKLKSRKLLFRILVCVAGVFILIGIVRIVMCITASTDIGTHTALQSVLSFCLSIATFSLSLVTFEKGLKKTYVGHVDLCAEVLSYDRFNEVCRYLEYWRKRPDTEQYPAMQNMGLNNFLDMLVRYGVRNNYTKTVTVYLSKDDIFMLHEFWGMCSAGKPDKAELSQADYVHLKMDRVPSYCKPDE